MIPSGAAVTILGVWIICQVIFGGALKRLKVLS